MRQAKAIKHNLRNTTRSKPTLADSIGKFFDPICRDHLRREDKAFAFKYLKTLLIFSVFSLLSSLAQWFKFRESLYSFGARKDPRSSSRQGNKLCNAAVKSKYLTDNILDVCLKMTKS